MQHWMTNYRECNHNSVTAMHLQNIKYRSISFNEKIKLFSSSRMTRAVMID